MPPGDRATRGRPGLKSTSFDDTIGTIMRRFVPVLLLFAACPQLSSAAPPFAPAVLPGELTVRLRIQHGERQLAARMLGVKVELDTGVRCVQPPCPEAGRSLELNSGRDATIRIPVADWSQVRSIQVEGAKVLSDPGGRSRRLADGSFLLVLEAEQAEGAGSR